MRIFRHYKELPEAVRGGAVALGNFDGVHLGHQAVIGAARQEALATGIPSGVMTFEPHPRSLFAAGAEPFRLTPFRIKARLIEGLSVDFLLMQHFDRAFASLSARDFVEQILIGGLGVRKVVVGYDFAFGQGRGGSLELLQEFAAKGHFELISIGQQNDREGKTFSSNLIRQALKEGRPDLAADLLGRAWEIEGRVETGDARGRTIGFPTANIHPADYLRPMVGVYAVRAGIDRGEATQWHMGVANLGRRPTFDKIDLLLEAHLFDFSGDLYGRHLRVALTHFIRPERKFDGLDALKAQIALDSLTARGLLSPDHTIGS